ncbi:DNA repair protein RadA [Thioalkalivibrio nitratireducens DSM 14787]|uniref:DNA repair protein RadA n=1 Tax=Thioalkalivibrio nitratireducens (strain DSM 14787 / UNIQEM 213 / ALEN2) TaxID=1255043 RepID=L0DZP2_THIND|nr:DNA repair protein RadA [Thioalkalivibrio nitratireducens]AGA35064.1 DNA repair protein RadA [Thioalkalivibrio nitratireducens DSM 14787]
MAKPKLRYVCRECGSISPKWSGQCGDCGAWNSMEELAPSAAAQSTRGGGYAGEAGRITRLGDVESREVPRIPTGLSELDRSLGGGLVHGSVVLIGGDPGIGKSTLLLQVLALLPPDQSLYVTGEESAQQVSLRAHRLGLDVAGLRLLTETQVENVIATSERERPRVLVIDSIQTLYSAGLQSAPGSVSQVRESAAALVRLAKQRGVTVILVGHVTKDGQIAGPRVLEHMVDTVLYFEGDPGGRYRMLRAVKNRFGAVNELGVFAMQEDGLTPVANPSAIFLSRHSRPVPGSVVMVTREGTRPLLVEVQALVAETHAPQPRRVTLGLEQNRLIMLLAVLGRHGGITLFDQDVFVNVVGGVRVSETAADLPMLVAALSSLRDRPLGMDLACFGEIGLSGEVRPVPNGEERLAEAVKHGMTRAIIPAGNRIRRRLPGIEIQPVEHLTDALDLV